MPLAPHSYLLCELCVRRQGAEAGFFRPATGAECFVCRGLMNNIPSAGKSAIRASRRYDFETFAVGVSLPEGVQEREDELRSDLKLKGHETIKTQTARLVAELVSDGSGKKVEKMRPDLSLLMDMERGEVSVGSRPVFFYGRYTKPAGLSQRRELCRHCGGTGCKKCNKTGFERRPSVEGEIRKRVSKFTGSQRMTFSWLGSEDRESRVYEPGRPFVVEVKNPIKRDFPRRFGTRVKGGKVVVSSGKVLPAKPLRLPPFKFRAEILGTAAAKVHQEGLVDLRKRFRRVEVRFERPYDKPTVKRVYSVSASVRGRTLLIDAELDGGLPVKRFVSGELVSPSVSEILKTEVRCRRFDIRGVRETGKFEFAEVTRSQKKN